MFQYLHPKRLRLVCLAFATDIPCRCGLCHDCLVAKAKAQEERWLQPSL